MCEKLIEILDLMEKFFGEYQFTEAFLMTCIGVIFGGYITISINRRTIRKEAYFKLQYDTLNELIDYVHQLEKNIEHLEIGLSFGDRKTKEFDEQIAIIEKSALELNEIFRGRRLLLHKIISGAMLEMSAQIPGEFFNIFIDRQNSSLTNIIHKEEVTVEDIERLRSLTEEVRKLKAELVDALESTIFPGSTMRVMRRIKKVKVFFGNVFGIWIVGRKKRKSNR